MVWLLLGVALAAPPSEAALQDVDAWTRRGRVLLDGPDTCVEVEGTATINVISFAPGGWLGAGERRQSGASGRFTGRLDHGTWTRLDAELVQQDPDHTVTINQLQPIVGHLPPTQTESQGHLSIGASGSGSTVDLGAGSQQAVNLIDRLIDEIDPATVTAYAIWEPQRQAVVLRQFVPMDDSPSPKEVELRTFFPDGGAPDAMDVVFPPRLSVGDGLIRVKLRNAQLHLRARETPLGVLPGVESTSLVVGVLGWTLGFEQRLVYERVRACGG